MKEFTESMPFVIFFMSVTVLLQSFTNERVTNGFLLLVLMSMVVTNSDKFIKLLNEVRV
ncbi:hypothetical protein P4U03_17750 [Bacillus mycoides]|uniref:Uncharacterized protein n=7 Tax=root TaxID=1 RepID=Q6X3U7_BP35C|nr:MULTISPECIES: hypothetical protein [Bacillaceae]NP_943768.1 putative protein 22 [Bacillus phage Bam35c]YP_010771362.1 hypothetical protein QIS55_gp24 [Bacillus phage Sato]YP_224121.1 hypothetical protein GIL16c_gp23 [Bacillus phage GIL16c]MEB4843986.1 hypothetical protein [Paenibacillus jamilae]MEC0301322.1 hypothetical protein [Peribacillus castrilensis]MEC0304915.1 hypothetical protein [Terribacillus saccharophilus]MED1305696.1 hypothetical protein [Bacillus pacificus]CAD59962.1 hypoth